MGELQEITNEIDRAVLAVIDALRSVEWLADRHDEYRCPWCGARGDDEWRGDTQYIFGEHHEDCKRQLALRAIDKAIPAFAEFEYLICPFCNDGKALGVKYVGDGRHAVVCGSCDAVGPKAREKEKAVHLWNNRVSVVVKSER